MSPSNGLIIVVERSHGSVPVAFKVIERAAFRYWVSKRLTRSEYWLSVLCRNSGAPASQSFHAFVIVVSSEFERVSLSAAYPYSARVTLADTGAFTAKLRPVMSAY